MDIDNSQISLGGKREGGRGKWEDSYIDIEGGEYESIYS